MGKKSAAAPAPDPNIGLAALKEAQIGEQWLGFAKEQFKEGNIRQQDMDALTTKVINSQLSSQEQANRWAAEDRDIQSGYREKYDKWADEDRALGRQTKAELDGYAKDALQKGSEYEGKFGQQAANQYKFADEQQQRYKSTFQPIEDRMASDAMSWDSNERQAAEAAKAKADVTQNAAAAQAANERNMASMGIDPRSGRHAGVARSTGLQTALAAAGAQNVARDQIRQQGLALRGQAAQVGQQVNANANTARGMGIQATGAAHSAQMAGQSQAMQAKNLGLAAAGVGNASASLGMGNQGGGYQGLGLGVTAGNSAVGNQGAANSNFYQNNNVMAQGFGGAMQGYHGQASALNSMYNTQVQAWSAQQQANATSAAGLGSMLGTGIGAYAAL